MENLQLTSYNMNLASCNNTENKEMFQKQKDGVCQRDISARWKNYQWPEPGPLEQKKKLSNTDLEPKV